MLVCVVYGPLQLLFPFALLFPRRIAYNYVGNSPHTIFGVVLCGCSFLLSELDAELEILNYLLLIWERTWIPLASAVCLRTSSNQN